MRGAVNHSRHHFQQTSWRCTMLGWSKFRIISTFIHIRHCWGWGVRHSKRRKNDGSIHCNRTCDIPARQLATQSIHHSQTRQWQIDITHFSHEKFKFLWILYTWNIDRLHGKLLSRQLVSHHLGHNESIIITIYYKSQVQGIIHHVVSHVRQTCTVPKPPFPSSIPALVS